MKTLTWRKGTADDEPLLFTLFAAGKAAEFAPLGWPPQQLQPLLEMQFRARQQSYAQSYPAAMDTILCREDGEPVGRHLVERQSDCYRGIDLAVLPEHRNRGIGTWALRQIQQLAALEGVVFRLRALRNNRALRLYERLGFIRIGSDELSFEMEWQPLNLADRRPRVEDRIALEGGAEAAREEVLTRIFGFLRGIGLPVHLMPVPSGRFLPGIQMVSGGLRVDLEMLLYPGDVLHEAGHMAVMTPERRAEEFPQSSDPAEEMAAIAWSYAAAMHIGLPVEIVFHPQGYRGQSQALMHAFATGNCIGLPYLWWVGMTTQPVHGRPSIYPRMLRWLRETPADVQAANSQEESFALQLSTAGPH
jgi:GNAT superfamily N-acetyltransferase